MRDLFYTILIVWVVWRILNSVNTMRAKKTSAGNMSAKKTGETTVNYVPPKKKSPGNDEGEYVEYEEIK
jgi:hypothetical protein